MGLSSREVRKSDYYSLVQCQPQWARHIARYPPKGAFRPFFNPGTVSRRFFTFARCGLFRCDPSGLFLRACCQPISRLLFLKLKAQLADGALLFPNRGLFPAGSRLLNLGILDSSDHFGAWFS
jgi:hypothetical protein